MRQALRVLQVFQNVESPCLNLKESREKNQFITKRFQIWMLERKDQVLCVQLSEQAPRAQKDFQEMREWMTVWK